MRRGVGISLKVAVTYIVIVLGVLILLNIYPVFVSQNFIFRSKQETLQDKAALLSATLSGMEELTNEMVSRVSRELQLDERSTTRIIVTDDAFRAVYDNSSSDNSTGKIILLQELRHAIAGNDVFYATYDNETIISKAAAPVMLNGQVIGAVYLYETDDELAALISDIRQNLMQISLIVCSGVIVLSFFLSRILFTRRIASLLKAIRQVREGDYGHMTEIRGTDELTDLAGEFNSMSERLMQVEEMRRRFVSDASHELKTPLASVKLLVDSIVQNDNMPPEVIREFVEGIGEETERLTRLTERLLNITRLDARVASVYPVELGEVVRRAARMLAPLAEVGGIEIKLRLEEDCIIRANDDDIYQIVFNLVENAIKYNRKDGKVTVYMFAKEGGITLIVDDTGIGIPAEDIDRVFERFYRVDKARSREEGGSGLGLAIVKTAVEQYGASIVVSSEVGEGTRMTLHFTEYSAEVERYDD